jgi:hypothetical protein
MGAEFTLRDEFSKPRGTSRGLCGQNAVQLCLFQWPLELFVE